MLRATLSIKGDFSKEIELAKDNLKEEIVGGFEEAAQSAVMRSPVWSGAYVKSFSALVNGSGPTRSRQSDPNVRVEDTAAKSEAMSQLASDLNPAYTIDLEDLKSITLINRAPHARLVEMGTKTSAGGIFAGFRDDVKNIRFGSVRRGRRS